MNEKLSSFIDGELDTSAVNSVYHDTVNDSIKLQSADRYQLIGDLLRNEYTDVAHHVRHSGVADRIQQQIEKEKTWDIQKTTVSEVTDEISTNNVIQGKFILKQPAFLSGFAVAAAISALAIFVFAPTGMNISGFTHQDNLVEAELKKEPISDDALTALLVEHGEFSGSAGINGLISYAKFVSHDSQQ